MGEVEIPPWLKALPQAPEFHPTEAEFLDPIAYILKIEEEAKQYGICKIIPPFAKASKKVVAQNLNRSLSLSREGLPSVVHSSSAPLSRTMGGVIFGPQLIKSKGFPLDASTTDAGKAKFTTRRQQLGWNPKRARGVAHSQNHKLVWQSGESYTLEQFEAKAKIFSRARLGTCKDVSPLSVESLFWRAAADKPISVEYANDIPGSAFAERVGSLSSRPLRIKKRKRFLEEADHRNLDSAGMVNNGEENFEEEECGAASEEVENFDAMKSKNGVLEPGGDNAGSAGWKLANSTWNMRNVARSQGSLLRFMPDEVPGVTSPMVYIGMLFSWFAWHVEDHELHSLNYLHMGASKTWYAVPGDAAAALEEAVRVHGYGGHLNPRAAFSLLGEKTTIMSPEVLVAAGVPCCRLVQNAGEYVVTFPRAYHLGFSHGFNCGEAANFATPGWLDVAKDAAARRAAMNYLPMLSHQQLLYLLTMSLPPRIPASSPSEPRSSRLKVRKKSLGEEMVKSVFLHDVVRNNRFLRILLDKGVSRCLLAKDAISHMPCTTVLLRGLENRDSVSPVGTVSSSGLGLAPDSYQQGIEGSSTSSYEEGTQDQSYHDQPFSFAPVQSSVNGSALEDHLAENGEDKTCYKSTDPSENSGITANELVFHDVEAKPPDIKDSKVGASLAIDWGTLPCAACGILCYATMAVVEPNMTAAMTFKPIYAAAGLGHCAIETGNSGKMMALPPKCSCPRSSQVVSTHADFVSALEADERIKQDKPTSMSTASVYSADYRPVVVKPVEQSSTAPGCIMCECSAIPSGLLQGRIDTSAVTQLGGDKLQEAGYQVPHSPLSPKLCLQMSPRVVTALVKPVQSDFQKNNDISHAIDEPDKVTEEESGHAAEMGSPPNLDPASSVPLVLPAESLYSHGRCEDGKEACHMKPARSVSFTTSTSLSDSQASDSQVIQGFMDMGPSLLLVNNTTIEDPEEPAMASEQGISPLDLLASLYEDSSDLEDTDNIFQACEGLDVPVESKESIYEEGGEVCGVLAKPHGGVGDLLTDVVGLSVDVPWLSLIPASELTNLLSPASSTPSFSFSSLVEGPKSLGKVFISSGFCFVEKENPVYPSFASSSPTQKQFERQSSELTTIDRVLNISTNLTENGKVIDMQELYRRINSQALTCDMEAGEEVLIHIGGRTWGPSVHIGAPYQVSKNSSSGEMASTYNSGALHGEASNVKKAGKDSPGLGNMSLAGKSPSKECCMPVAAMEEVQLESVGRPCEPSVHGEDCITSCEAGSTCFQGKDHIQDILPRSGCKIATPRPCKSVARPRVLCLEHAVEAQQQLQAVGGAHVLLVCHSDFENYELRAKDLAEEFGIGHTWINIPFSQGADDDLSMVSTAVAVEDDEGQKVSDWVLQMGLFIHRFRERESESSDDTHNFIEDFRKGPFGRRKQGMADGTGLMAGRLGLSHKYESRPISHCGSSSQRTIKTSRVLCKASKKKRCVVAGRWCGRVWRVNQVHPFLGGCRKVDPSLHLGMSSTSLYALSMMSEWDGGKYRKALSSNRNDAHLDGHFIPVKGDEDQQSVVAQKRNRKRKVLEQVTQQLDNASEGQIGVMVTVTSCPQNTLAACKGFMSSGEYTYGPKQDSLREGRDYSEPVEDMLNDGEAFNMEDSQLQVNQPLVSPHFAHLQDADYAVQTSPADLRASSPQFPQMVSPIPLASHDPSTIEDRNGGLDLANKAPLNSSNGVHSVTFDKHMVSVVNLGQSECSLSTDEVNTDAQHPVSMQGPAELQEGGDRKGFGFHLIPSDLSDNLIRLEQSDTPEDGGYRHMTLHLTNGSPALQVTQNNNGSSALFATSSPTNRDRGSIVSQEAPCVWRDVPVACAQSFHPASPSFHPIMSPFTGQYTNQFIYPLLNNDNNNKMYIPYISTSAREALSNQPSVVESPQKKEIVYSEVSNAFDRSVGGEKLEGVQLMPESHPAHIRGHWTAEADFDQQRPAEALQCSPRMPLDVLNFRQVDCHLYHNIHSAGLTHVPRLSPSLLDSHRQVTLAGKGDMGSIGVAGQGSLEHPLGSLLPLPTSSRGRPAVKARGKRAKHVGWRNIKPSQPDNSVETLLRTWETNPQSHASPSTMFSLQPVQCNEARFEVEDCGRRFKILQQSTGPASPSTSLPRHGATAEENDMEEAHGKELETAADKPKKKGKAKKSKLHGRKPVGDDGEFQCDLDGCRMSFETDAELQIHKRNRCTFKGCGKRFFMHKYLLQHRRVHLDERPLKCPWKGCKQAFKWAWARTEHIRVHTGERPYACPDCDQTFRFVSDFSRHKRNTGHTKM